MRILLVLLLTLSAPAWAKAILFDALIARVGQDSVTMNDLTRFRDVENIMVCVGLRKKVNDQNLRNTLERYVDEELFYIEAKAKKQSSSGELARAIDLIRGKSSCKADWAELGRLYGKAWQTDSRPKEGESMLVRELEKRLLIDRFIKTENIGEVSEWVREAKVRHPVKLYLE